MEPLLHIDREQCLQLERSITRDWIETDGRGGYASSTILMGATTRYHGLLCAWVPALRRRFLFLSRFEETLSGAGRSFPLSLARYPGLWSPQGHPAIEHFELAPHPVFTYVIGGTTIRREVRMLRGQPTVLVRWSVDAVDTPLTLELRPIYAFREAGALTSENIELDPRTERLANGIRSRPYASLPALSITAGPRAPRFEADPVWYRRIEYLRDLERGYDGHEDNFSPGRLLASIAPGADVVVAATIGSPLADPAAAWERVLAPGRSARASAAIGLRALAVAADDFLWRERADGRLGVVAGFPWLGERARDTFIALPGLLLARGEIEACGDALEGALVFLERGHMPSEFGATRADSRYAAADTSLWFARAVRLYENAGGSGERVLSVFRPALAEIARTFLSGTDLGVFVDERGVLHAGDPSRCVTWMDATTAAGPVTPRSGCAVEIGALWWFLLAYLEHLDARAGDRTREKEWEAHKRLAKRGFLERFWLDDARYLADVWNDGAADRSVRPNMLIAASLEFSPLSRGKRTDVVQRAEVELLTPRGLRTLSPKNPDYRGAYRGSREERDRARHQGTVFPWLIGPYVEAYLRAFAPRGRELDPLRELLAGFDELLDGYGLQHVSELFDGDPPHRPNGATAQAWNTAELLRAWRLLEERA